MKLRTEQIDTLAYPLVKIIQEFFTDPKREKEFEKWLLTRNSETSSKQS